MWGTQQYIWCCDISTKLGSISYVGVKGVDDEHGVNDQDDVVLKSNRCD